MKKIGILLVCVFLLFVPTTSYALEDEPLGRVESYFGIDWENLPASYEYNWDNSDNCWKWGVWIDGVQYLLEPGTFDTNVRHKIQGYYDETYVYLRIVFSRDYSSKVNGNNYIFYVDDLKAQFRVSDKTGGSIGDMYSMQPGTRFYEVRHEDNRMSNEMAGEAYLTKHPENYNAVLELRIPITELKYQNNKIDIESIGLIEFYCPNLMYRRASIAGASTYPYVLAAVVLIGVPGTTALLKYRKKKL